MLTLTIILRLIHVLCGAAWLGFVVFATFVLMPAAQDVGPPAGPVMAALQKRGMTAIPPVLALLTLASGLALYWQFTGGFTAGIITSPVGAAFGLGGLLAFLGFGLGMAILRPAMIRIGALTPQLASAGEAERAAMMSEIASLRARSRASSRIVAAILILATALMAVARYL